MLRGMVAMAVGLFFLPGCEGYTEECERARMELSKNWSSVRQSANKRKQGGIDAAEWAVVENKADLLRSAFETRQVTWDSANDARKYIVTRVQSLRAEGDLNMLTFQTTLKRAVDTQDDFAHQCK